MMRFVIAVLESLIADELSTWMSRWAERLLTRAVAQVRDEDLRRRIDEEWRADLVTWPSGITRLIVAGSLWLRGARQLRDGAGLWSLRGRLMVAYARVGWLSCRVAWLFMWTVPHVLTLFIFQAITLILLGFWLAYGHPVLYWMYMGTALANMATQMWLTPAIRVYIGVNCANFVLSALRSVHPEWFPAGFIWGFLAVFILSTVFMIPKVLRVSKQLAASNV
jgi:hypothetical protein